ncbi:MAG: arginase family protein [Crenarchaeota archaeon]|nr:arginase family protein [Thermoproteota archaeon]MCR8454066.1 arginase family protein [Thermoproteota archaeon]MCR8455852.1 arginase family protein [Thermoproteota archaeon]MCR8462947.1 arginase family protein [Thermoproteota archaeon]MCR8471138.1 arginase family protein [Thermoproteota archaeon]
MPILNHVTLFGLPAAKNLDIAVLGIPFDSTQSAFVGSRHGPLLIRLASKTLNEFSLFFKRSVSEFPISDWGDVEVIHGGFLETMQKVREALGTIGAKKYLFLGGDHSITIMTLQHLHNQVKMYVHIDADPDFEDTYQELKYSHGCTLRRAGELLGYDRVVLLGYRTGIPEELKALEEFGVEAYSTYDILENEAVLKDIFKKADYISLDLDVFDPAYAPDVGTPEPFGLPPNLLLRYLKYLRPKFADIVELTGGELRSTTATLAAAIARELLIAMST